MVQARRKGKKPDKAPFLILFWKYIHSATVHEKWTFYAVIPYPNQPQYNQSLYYMDDVKSEEGPRVKRCERRCTIYQTYLTHDDGLL